MNKAGIHIALILLITGCDDFLDQQPGLAVSIDEQLSTEVGLEQALAGVYVDMEEILSAQTGVYADLQGGNLAITPNRTNGVISVPELVEDIYSFSDTELDTRFGGFYSGQYSVIAQVNTILERAPYSFLSGEKND